AELTGHTGDQDEQDIVGLPGAQAATGLALDRDRLVEHQRDRVMETRAAGPQALGPGVAVRAMQERLFEAFGQGALADGALAPARLATGGQHLAAGVEHRSEEHTSE